MTDEYERVLTGVGPRLKRLRQDRSATLQDVSTATGISVSTLSRLESGQRRPTLELLLPLAREYSVAIDELVGAPETGDPRVRLQPVKRGGMTMIPLTRKAGGLQAYKMIIPHRKEKPDPQRHEGYEWMYVLNGRLRLILGDHELVLGPGEAAEFDTRVAHWFGSADADQSVEILSLFGSQGERAHLRASTRRKSRS
jgi:transcriptional regulator with XRE-family HTH domain